MAVDLMIAVMIFLLLMAVSLAIWSSGAASATKRQLESEMQEAAENTADLLVSYAGNPADWEEGSADGWTIGEIDAIATFGLAKRDRVLDTEKVENFIALSTSHSDSVKTKLLIGDSDYFLQLIDQYGNVLKSGDSELKAGENPDNLQEKSSLMEVKVQRVVTYEGNPAILEFTLYREK